MEWAIAIFLVSGLVSGFMGGLLGIGGGVITVPILYYVLSATHLVPSHTMQIAVSTSLATSFVTAACSSFLHWKKEAISFFALKWIVPSLILGCAGGAWLAHHLASHFLKWIFGGMALFIGAYFTIPRLPPLSIASRPNFSLSVFSLGVGFLSSLLGIGGGVLVFPILLGYQLPAQNASATSSVSTLVSTGIGSLAFFLVAWHLPELPGIFGYVDGTAFWAISLGALFGSPVGVRYVHLLPVSTLKRIFGLCLTLVGLCMLFF